MTLDNNTTEVTCANCPFARLIDGNRYACSAAHNTHNSVVRGHWEATDDCLDAIEELEQEEILSQVESQWHNAECTDAQKTSSYVAVNTQETLNNCSTNSSPTLPILPSLYGGYSPTVVQPYGGYSPLSLDPEPLSLDPEVDYILELEAKLERDASRRESVYPEIEIDATDAADLIGLVYRVWQGRRLLGIFWRSPFDGLWLVDPLCNRVSERYKTAQEAQDAIVTAWN